MSQRAMSIDNISFLSPVQYDFDKDPSDNYETKEISEQNDRTDLNDSEQTRISQDDQEIEEDNNIIPWKKLLRKTNSRLNLIS